MEVSDKKEKILKVIKKYDFDLRESVKYWTC